MTENRFVKNILNEVYNYYTKDILNENKESKMRSMARKYTKSKGYNNKQAKDLEMSILHNIPNVRLGGFKFLLGVTRLAIEQELTDSQSIMKMNQYMSLMTNPTHIDEYDNNLNDMSFDEIDYRFSTIQQELNQEEMDKSNARQYTENRDYTIVRIPDAKTASEYGKYTEWCVTHDQQAYDDYTSEGLGIFYFCLKNGFENVPEEQGENCPLDEYGLSMIAVSINQDGSPNTITCKWNHSNGGNDNIMTTEQLEQVIGRGFYKTFPPRPPEELQEVMNQQVREIRDEFWYEVSQFGVLGSNAEPLFDLEAYRGRDNDYDDYDDDYYDDDCYEDESFSGMPFCYEHMHNSGSKYIIVSGDGDLMCDRWFYGVDTNVGLGHSNIVRLNPETRKIGQYNLYDYQKQKLLIPENVIGYQQESNYLIVKKQNGMTNLVNIRGEFAFDEDVLQILSPAPLRYGRRLSYCTKGPLQGMEYVYVVKQNNLKNIIILANGKEHSQLFKNDVDDCFTNSLDDFIFVPTQDRHFTYIYNTKSLQLIYNEPLSLYSQTSTTIKRTNKDGSVSYSQIYPYLFRTMDGKELFYHCPSGKFITTDNIQVQ